MMALLSGLLFTFIMGIFLIAVVKMIAHVIGYLRGWR